MIQFNLLPDIKLAYIKSRRLKRMIILSSIAVSAVAIFILVVLATAVLGIQKKHLNDLNNDVIKITKDLKAKPDLDKVLTIQNQLKNLPTLHANKPVASRLFLYFSQVTPVQIGISKLSVGFDDSTMTITGVSDSLNSVNTFIDTLKFTSYTTGADSNSSPKAFNTVVLASFNRDKDIVSYTVTLKFDPVIFNSKNEITLVVPTQVTTRSETEKPVNPFQVNPNDKTQ